MVNSHAGLTDEQERRRREGLRMLARIIARHYVQQPQWCAADHETDQAGESGPTGAPKSKDGPLSATEEQ